MNIEASLEERILSAKGEKKKVMFKKVYISTYIYIQSRHLIKVRRLPEQPAAAKQGFFYEGKGPDHNCGLDFVSFETSICCSYSHG